MSVDQKGHVTDAKLSNSSGDEPWDALALTSVRAWTFIPATSQCKAVAAQVAYAVGSGGDVDLPFPCEHAAQVHGMENPEYPNAARGYGGWPMQVSIKVVIDAIGRLVSANIVQSTGSTILDEAALRAALRSSYIPRVHQCVPTDDWYVFRVTFDPNR